MIKKIIFFLAIFSSLVVANAQKTKRVLIDKKIVVTDSIKKIIIHDTIKKDTINVNSLWKIFKVTARASYYADQFHGRLMANGRRFDMNKLSVAHKSLRFGTKLKVTNIANKKFVIVEVTDRGPFVKSREIDLSKKAFMDITNNRGGGLMTVKIEIMK